MQNNLQQPNFPTVRRPSPYDRPGEQTNNPYAPQRRPLPPDPPTQRPEPEHGKVSSDPYSSAFELLQGTFGMLFIIFL